MTGFQATTLAVVIVFSLATVLLIGVIALKLVRRRRAIAHDLRRATYLVMLSRHVAAPGTVPEISLFEAEDDAFIDALIDIRNTVAGPAVDALDGIVDRTGLINLQAKRLRARFPLGRRLRAAVSLAEIGDARAAHVLMHHLDDREPEIRVQCARGLGRMGYTAAIDLILDRFPDETPWVRGRFAETLISFGRSATWPLMSFARVNHSHEEHPGVTEAIRILGIIGDLEVGPALAELLYTANDVETSIAIIEALGEVGGPMALRPLKRAFQSDDWRLRAKAATAFGEIGDPSINAVVASGLSDASWWTRRNSAAALAALPGGIDMLHDALLSTDRFARDAAAEALADCGELIAARERSEHGAATRRDQRLLDYMDAPGLVLS